MRGAQPRRAADRGHHHVRLPMDCFDHGQIACATRDSGSGEGRPQFAAEALVGERGKAGAEPTGGSREGLGIAPSDHSLHPTGVPLFEHHFGCRTADRAGRSEDRDGSGHVTTSSTSKIAPTKAATAQNPSRRSITPPWPGMRWLESFTSNLRLRADSARSPPWLAIEAMPDTTAAVVNETGESQPKLSATKYTRIPLSTPAPSPPKKPDQVFFGLTRGQSFGPPRDRKSTRLNSSHA